MPVLASIIVSEIMSLRLDGFACCDRIGIAIG